MLVYLSTKRSNRTFIATLTTTMGICTCVNGMNGNGMNGQTSRVMSLVARRTGPGVGCPPIRSHHGGDGQRGVATVPQLHMMMGMKRRRNERRMYAGRMVMVKASVALESFMGDDGELEVPDMERYGPCRGNKSRPCGGGRADEKGPGKKPVTPKSATLVDVIPYLLQLALADRGLYWRLGGAMVALVVYVVCYVYFFYVCVMYISFMYVMYIAFFCVLCI